MHFEIRKVGILVIFYKATQCEGGNVSARVSEGPLRPDEVWCEAEEGRLAAAAEKYNSTWHVHAPGTGLGSWQRSSHLGTTTNQGSTLRSLQSTERAQRG